MAIPQKKPGWTPEIQSGSNEFRAQLQQLAREEKTGFFDAEGAWGAYLVSTKMPATWLMRDPIHANARGHQVLARSLLGYFSRSGTPDSAAGSAGKR